MEENFATLKFLTTDPREGNPCKLFKHLYLVFCFKAPDTGKAFAQLVSADVLLPCHRLQSIYQ